MRLFNFLVKNWILKVGALLVLILSVGFWVLSDWEKNLGPPAEDLWRRASAPRPNTIEVRIGNGSDGVSIFTIDFATKKWIGMAEWTAEKHGPATEAARFDSAQEVIGGNDGSLLTDSQLVAVRKWTDDLPAPLTPLSSEPPHIKIAIRFYGEQKFIVYGGVQAKAIVRAFYLAMGEADSWPPL